jgi:hypothetical protein
MVFDGKKDENNDRRSQGYNQFDQTAFDAEHPPADEPRNKIGRSSQQLRHGRSSLFKLASSRKGRSSARIIAARMLGGPAFLSSPFHPLVSNFLYPNGPLGNYQYNFLLQPALLPLGRHLLETPFDLSFNRVRLLNKMFNGSGPAGRNCRDRTGQSLNVCIGLQNQVSQ